MKKIEENLQPDKDYRELFTVEVDELKCTDTVVGLKNDGLLLYIDEKLSNSGNAYWMDRTFYSIEKDEFKQYFEIAKSNGEIEKTIKNKKTSWDDLDQIMKI